MGKNTTCRLQVPQRGVWGSTHTPKKSACANAMACTYSLKKVLCGVCLHMQKAAQGRRRLFLFNKQVGVQQAGKKEGRHIGMFSHMVAWIAICKKKGIKGDMSN